MTNTSLAIQPHAKLHDPPHQAHSSRQIHFGGGVNAFSRYENGKTKPPLALLKLFRLLDRPPDLLDEVRAD